MVPDRNMQKPAFYKKAGFFYSLSGNFRKKQCEEALNSPPLSETTFIIVNPGWWSALLQETVLTLVALEGAFLNQPYFLSVSDNTLSISYSKTRLALNTA